MGLVIQVPFSYLYISMEINFFELENDYVKRNFNLDYILEFQKYNDTQIIRGADWQYECWINGGCYYISLTPLYTLLLGIIKYKELNEKK